MFEEIFHKGEVIAIIVKKDFHKPGIHFFTQNNLSQQLAYMSHPSGKTIDPHIHKKVKRDVYYTQETIILKKGKLKVDFYDEEQVYLESRVLEAGDIILLIKCGHGFTVLEDIEMYEVKQGPYAGDEDKIRFNKVTEEQ
jgi:mannose-6-phosphate isomerase-like protein (cupin superfamily)